MSAIEKLRAELLKAELILNTKYSFSLAETNYVNCLQIIDEFPEQRPKFVQLLKSMFLNGEVSDEPIAFLMHALRWSEILDWAQNESQHLKNPIGHARPFMKIAAAFDDNWENGEFYKLFNPVP